MSATQKVPTATPAPLEREVFSAEKKAHTVVQKGPAPIQLEVVLFIRFFCPRKSSVPIAPPRRRP
jgi:hypothetical protein